MVAIAARLSSSCLVTGPTDQQRVIEGKNQQITHNVTPYTITRWSRRVHTHAGETCGLVVSAVCNKRKTVKSFPSFCLVVWSIDIYVLYLEGGVFRRLVQLFINDNEGIIKSFFS